MKITVFGATGRTGRHVVAQGVHRHHAITAFTRRPHALGDGSALAAVVHGDGRDADAVHKAVDGADAVVSTITAGRRKDPHQAADVSETIIRAMTSVGVRRLVVTSAYPIVAETPRLLVTLLRFLLVTAYADAAAMEQVVSGSGLDWTIVRLNRLTDKPGGGGVHISRDLLARPRAIARADVAAVLLDIVEGDALSRTAVNVSGRRKGCAYRQRLCAGGE
jgi:putative NADH-flavin reductase